MYLFDDYALITCNFKEETMKVSLEDIEGSDFGNFVKAQKNKPELGCSDLFKVGDSIGTRTRVCAVRGRRPNR